MISTESEFSNLNQKMFLKYFEIKYFILYHYIIGTLVLLVY